MSFHLSFWIGCWCTWIAGTTSSICSATISFGSASMNVRHEASRSSRNCFILTKTCGDEKSLNNSMECMNVRHEASRSSRNCFILTKTWENEKSLHVIDSSICTMCAKGTNFSPKTALFISNLSTLYNQTIWMNHKILCSNCNQNGNIN